LASGRTKKEVAKQLFIVTLRNTMTYLNLIREKDYSSRKFTHIVGRYRHSAR
jgi:hypothetical protein